MSGNLSAIRDAAAQHPLDHAPVENIDSEGWLAKKIVFCQFFSQNSVLSTISGGAPSINDSEFSSGPPQAETPLEQWKVAAGMFEFGKLASILGPRQLGARPDRLFLAVSPINDSEFSSGLYRVETPPEWWKVARSLTSTSKFASISDPRQEGTRLSWSFSAASPANDSELSSDPRQAEAQLDRLFSAASPANDSELSSDPRQVEAQLDRLFSAAHNEQFEVGMESRFSENLQNLFAYYPDEVVKSLKERLLEGIARPEVLAEMLQWASRQEAIPMREPMIDLLCTGLRSPSSLIRDTAASSLAHLDESVALPHLQRAIEREKVPELREDLEDLVHSLEI